MGEKCLFCDREGVNPIGTNAICSSCVSDLYEIINKQIKSEIKDEIGNNRDLKRFELDVREKTDQLQRDISQLQRDINTMKRK